MLSLACKSGGSDNNSQEALNAEPFCISQLDSVSHDVALGMQDRLLQGLQGSVTVDAARQRALESILQVHCWTSVL